mgnify:CR=1 FL=1
MILLKKIFGAIVLTSVLILNCAAKNLEAFIALDTLSAFSPDGDGINDKLVISLNYTGGSSTPQSWLVKIIDQRGFVVKKFSAENTKIPKRIIWDGSTDSGEEIYSLNDYSIHLVIVPKEKDIKKTGQQELYVIKYFKSGILLETIEQNKNWSFYVNSLMFSGESKELSSIEEQSLDNDYILEVIAAKLNEKENSAVTIICYENNTKDTVQNNIEKVLPLSQQRAETVLEALVQKGVARERLSATGRGGANPLSNPKDEDTNWKNSRIEFHIEAFE